MPEPISAVLGATGLLSAGVGAYSASEASKAQQQAAQQGIDAQERMFQKQTELQEPFRQAGIGAQNQLLTYLGLPGGDVNSPEWKKYTSDFSTANFEADPGYAFRLAEGQKALDRSAAARGGLQSGAALKAAARYGQDYGSQEYTNAFNRYQTNRANQLNPLQSIMGAGQTSANTLTNAAGQNATNLMQGYGNMGAARASGYMGMGNSLTNAINQGTNAYMQSQLINKLGTSANPYAYGAAGYTGMGPFMPGVPSGGQ
jgi:hypothetical protein